MADELRMPLTAHLDELRWRLIKCLLAVGVAFVPCYGYFADDLILLLTRPLRRINPDLPMLIGTGLAEAFVSKVKVSFIAGLFLASPVVLYQTWRFVAPGLYKNEKGFIVPFVLFGSLFFVGGAGFCYVAVLPVAYGFLVGQFSDVAVEPALRISEYLTFTSRLMLAFAITFEMPVLTFFLARTGLVDHKVLLRFARYAVVVIFIVAAILTPPDVVSQILLAAPLLVLYAVSVGVAYMVHRKAKPSA